MGADFPRQRAPPSWTRPWAPTTPPPLSGDYLIDNATLNTTIASRSSRSLSWEWIARSALSRLHWQTSSSRTAAACCTLT